MAPSKHVLAALYSEEEVRHKVKELQKEGYDQN